MSVHCRYHCRACSGHFTSLEAFDAHREGSAGTHRACSFPDGAGLVELVGTCNIADPRQPRLGVAVYSGARAGRALEAFGTRAGRRPARAKRKSAVLA